METYKKIVDDHLDQYLSIPSKKLREAVLYSLKSPGKRLRPGLVLASFYANRSSFNANDPIPFACAIEMIHAYSLIHDDLPAMDNDDMRRGLPTNHVVHGEDMAILAGDLLLNTAYETMATHCAQNPDRQNLAAMKLIAKAAGQMVSGQASDIVATGQPITGKQLLAIHQNKTAALIHAAVMAGAILATDDRNKLQRLSTAGWYMGLAFQIKDDYMDSVHCESETKKSNSDARNHKATYTSLFGTEKALLDSERCKRIAIECLEACQLKNKDLQLAVYRI